MKNIFMAASVVLFSAVGFPLNAEPLTPCAQHVKVSQVKDLGGDQFLVTLETIPDEGSSLNSEVFGEGVSPVLKINSGELSGTYVSSVGEKPEEQPMKGVDLVNLLIHISQKDKLLDLSCTVDAIATGEFQLKEFLASTVEDPVISEFQENIRNPE